MYQELLLRTRPDIVVETGTFAGGSDVTVDIDGAPARPVHPRLKYITGSSVDPEIFAAVAREVAGTRALVILDSDHREAHVYEELLAYRTLVKPGDYLIVEDTNVNGHPTFPEFGPGPMEAVRRFLAENDDFESDRRCERFLMTLNPNGYLRRKKNRKNVKPMKTELTSIHFDIVGGCQLRCVDCPNSTILNKVTRLEPSVFGTCLANIYVDHVHVFRLFNYGESLLHDDLPANLRSTRNSPAFFDQLS